MREQAIEVHVCYSSVKLTFVLGEIEMIIALSLKSMMLIQGLDFIIFIVPHPSNLTIFDILYLVPLHVEY